MSLPLISGLYVWWQDRLAVLSHAKAGPVSPCRLGKLFGFDPHKLCAFEVVDEIHN